MRIGGELVEGRFVARDNHFRVTAEVGGREVWAHLPNSGRLGELLLPGRRVVLVENVPAMVCDACMEQFYDDETTEALTRLTEEGFPRAEQTGEVLVPIYSLKRPTPPKEDEVVWPVNSA